MKELYEIKAKNVHQLLKAFQCWNETYSCNTFGQSVHFAANSDTTADKIAAHLRSQAINQFEITKCRATIEDCFIELMEKSDENNN